MDPIRLRMSMGYVVHLDKQSSEMRFRGGASVDGFDGSSDQTLKRNPLTYSSFQPVLHNWCNNGRCLCYPCLWDGAYKRFLAANPKE